jgi:transposase
LIAREQQADARAAYQAAIIQHDPATLIFLDETSLSRRLTPLRGRCPRGERLVERVPRGRWESVTYLATISLAGIGPSVLLPGALDRRALEVFVAEQLAPALTPGQTVIWDNLAVHKSARAQALIEAAGCRLRFLPTYSPDFNPIEQAFSQLKAHLRRRRPRAFDDLVAATAAAIDQLTPLHAANFFAEAGLPPGHKS